jgi:alpha-D-ribose 1-methylphosphonate 5-triphosphate synthase subunit PhnG
MADRNAADPRETPLIRRRRDAMAVLADGETAEIARGLASLREALGALPAHDEVRAAECGLVMVQGRIGGDGAPFCLGEATVSRAAVRLASGETGFGYVLGRDREKARLMALCDALIQIAPYRESLETDVVAPIRHRLAAERRRRAQQVAATKVEFFTLVRGED